MDGGVYRVGYSFVPGHLSCRLLGLRGTPGLAIEAKRHERLSVDTWMQQARKNCGLDRPVVINRKSRQPTHDSYVVLYLQDFADLYQGWLAHNGYVTGGNDEA